MIFKKTINVDLLVHKRLYHKSNLWKKLTAHELLFEEVSPVSCSLQRIFLQTQKLTKIRRFFIRIKSVK